MVPGPDHVAAAWGLSDRKPPVLVNLQPLYGSGRLANTGYLSILPVDRDRALGARPRSPRTRCTSIRRTS